jgi:hypothetical protein
MPAFPMNDLPEMIRGQIDPGLYIRSLASISLADWRHLWRHLPHLDSSTVPKYAVYHSPLKIPVQASLTKNDWQYWEDEIATLQRFAAERDTEAEWQEGAVPLSEFLDRTYRVAKWLAEHGEIEMIALNGKCVGSRLPFYQWPHGEYADADQEISFYKNQSDQENPYRPLILGQILTHKSDDTGFEFLDAAMGFSATRQRAIHAKADLFIEDGTSQVKHIEGADAHWYSPIQYARAAAFLWYYAAFMENPEEALKLGWHDRHLGMLDVLESAELAAIYDVLGSTVAPVGITAADVEILFLDQNAAPSGVRTLDGLRKERSPEWQKLLNEFRTTFDPDTKH